MYLAIFSFSGGEILIVFLAVLVLFGSKKIPELARMLGKGMNEFRKATEDLKREFREGTQDFSEEIRKNKEELDQEIREIHDSLPDNDYAPYEDLDDVEDKDSKDNDEPTNTIPRS